MQPVLPAQFSEKAASFPESSYGATSATVVLSNGQEVPNVVLAWSREIVRIGSLAVHSEAQLPFKLSQIQDVLPAT